MQYYLLEEILSALITALVASVLGLSWEGLLRPLFRNIFKKKSEKSFGERLTELTANLNKASEEVDTVLREMESVTAQRQVAVQRLQTDLESMESRETELKSRIADLEKTPIPAVEHFAALINRRERRVARRDYVLFLAGVLLMTIVSLAISLFFDHRAQSAPPTPAPQSQSQTQGAVTH